MPLILNVQKEKAAIYVNENKNMMSYEHERDVGLY